MDDLRNSRFLADSANFAPRARGLSESRHTTTSVEPLSFEREVLGILLEEPALGTEYAQRISPARFRNEVYRRIYERIVAGSGSIPTTADVFGLFAEDQGSLDVLAELSRRDRSSAVRYGDTEERRAHLERVVERLQLEEERQRYRELSDLIDDQISGGQRGLPRVAGRVRSARGKTETIDF